MSQQPEKRLTPLREAIQTIRDRMPKSRANNYLQALQEAHESDIELLECLLKKEHQLLSEAFDAGITATLKDIQKGFLDPANQRKADHLRDREVFQAVGETIINFPHPKGEQFLSQFKQDQ